LHFELDRLAKGLDFGSDCFVSHPLDLEARIKAAARHLPKPVRSIAVAPFEDSRRLADEVNVTIDWEGDDLRSHAARPPEMSQLP
jgi:hypothetical protein